MTGFGTRLDCRRGLSPVGASCVAALFKQPRGCSFVVDCVWKEFDGGLVGSTGTDSLSGIGAAFAGRSYWMNQVKELDFQTACHLVESCVTHEPGVCCLLEASLCTWVVLVFWSQFRKSTFHCFPICSSFSQVGTCQTVRDVRAVNHHDVVLLSAVCHESWFAGSASAGLSVFGGGPSSGTVQQEYGR